MVSLAFHLFVIGTVIFAMLLCLQLSTPLLQTVVYQTVVIWWGGFCVCVFLHLMLAGRQPFGVLRWFQLFCFFHLVSAVCLPDQGSHFSFVTSICDLVFLSLPQAFVVCSFFLCHRHLCTVSFFHGFFCRRHSSQTFCLCLVSACFRVSVYLSIFGFMLCASCSSASSLEIRTGIFSRSVTLWTALQIIL